MTRRATPRVFALEGEWSTQLDDRSSVEPLLETLQRAGQVEYIYRRVGTVDALQEYVRRWQQQRYARYSFGYFAFHGSPGSIHLGRKTVSVVELGEMLRGALPGRIVHFGTCETVLDVEQIDEFRRITGARAVTGFTRAVDWLESAAFEMLLIDAVSRYTRADAIERHLRRVAPDLAERLGFQLKYGRLGAGGVTAESRGH